MRVVIQAKTKPKRKAPAKRVRADVIKRTLRPADVEAEYGIPQSTLCNLCEHPDESKRLPSVKLPGRPGTKSHKGARLVFRDDLEAFLQKFRKAGAVG